MGESFQSEGVLRINIVFQLDRLKEGKWRKAIPHFKSNEYELLQMHRLKFRNLEPGINTDLRKAEKEIELIRNEYKKVKYSSLKIRV